MTGQLVDLAGLQQVLHSSGFNQSSAAQLCQATTDALAGINHGDLPRWQQALASLKQTITDQSYNTAFSSCLTTDTVSVSPTNPLHDEQQRELLQALQALRPWRKGPYEIAGIHIDTEWRSDWKWQRLSPHITPLENRVVLDVGCGNGYHGWRMRGDGARLVIGIDPSLLFLCQFQALQQFIRDPAFQLLPLRMETLPTGLASFDTVFSMGVLYHRRDYLAHLEELKGAMKPGGELVLETLIIDSDGLSLVEPATQVPKHSAGSNDEPSSNNEAAGQAVGNGRYARMRNVWALPSEALLHQWLEQSGFEEIRTADISVTSVAEQRSTDWMPFESLAEALDPTDPSLTVEGWPAPRRAFILAKRPDQ